MPRIFILLPIPLEHWDGLYLVTGQAILSGNPMMVENIMSRIYRVRKIIFIISPHNHSVPSNVFLLLANVVTSCIGIASFFKNRKKEQSVKNFKQFEFPAIKSLYTFFVTMLIIPKIENQY